MKTIQEYVDGNGIHCPNCDSDDITGIEQVQVEGRIATQAIECATCGARWWDEFTLTGYTLIRAGKE